MHIKTQLIILVSKTTLKSSMKDGTKLKIKLSKLIDFITKQLKQLDQGFINCFS